MCATEELCEKVWLIFLQPLERMIMIIFFSKSKAACQSATTSGMKIGNVQSVVRGTGATTMSRYGKIYFLTLTQVFI